MDYLPASIGEYTFVSHYSGSTNFAENKARALELLKTYRDRAKLIVTTMLHCALPAIAMGIPVVVFLPLNEGAQHESDLERFSSLSELVRVFRLSETALVDWQGYVVDVSALKLKLIDSFFAMAARWGRIVSAGVTGIAPSSELPVPTSSDVQAYFSDPDRLERLEQAKAPDRQRWGAASSYKAEWARRGQAASHLIRDGSRVLEIGTGTGTFRSLVAHRCRYTGADLEPLDIGATLALDLDDDPIPAGPWDTIVLLGVLEYLYNPVEALRKLANAAPHVVISYCCCLDHGPNSIAERRARGWINAMAEQNIRDQMGLLGFYVSSRQCLNSTPYFEQIIFDFMKEEPASAELRHD
jgi:hypothetical protein